MKEGGTLNERSRIKQMGRETGQGEGDRTRGGRQDKGRET